MTVERECHPKESLFILPLLEGISCFRAILTKPTPKQKTLVIQIRRQPALGFLHAHAFALRVIRYLVFLNLAQPEVP